MEMQLTGDWNKAMNFFKKLEENDKLLIDVLSKDIGKFIEVRLKGDIINESLGLVPLSEATIRQRGRGKVLVDTSEYVNKLRVLNVSIKGNSVTVTVGAGNESHSSGLTMSELAYIIEYGTQNQPPRPHFKLSWDKMQREVKNKVQESIEKRLRSIL